MTKGGSIRALLDVAESWQAPGLKALDNPVIVSHIGEKKTRQMRRLAQGAGKLLIGMESSHLIQSRNNLFFMPLTDGIPVEATKTITMGRKQLVIPIGKIAASGIPMHYYKSNWPKPKLDVIALPAAYDFSDIEKGAMFVHELTHALQLRRDGVGTSNDTPRHEGEAYDDQFKVLDYYWDGKLSRVVELNQNPGGLYEIEASGTGMAEHLRSSAVLTYPVVTAIRNAVHGYAPGDLVMPDALVAEYSQLGLLHTL